MRRGAIIAAVAVMFVAASTLLAQGMVSRGVRAAPRAKPSGLPWLAEFRDVAAQAGLTQPIIYGGVSGEKYLVETSSGGVALFDYNSDGETDIFIVGGTRFEDPPPAGAGNRLYRNNGNGTFTDVTAKAGLQYVGWCSSVAVGDYNNDGALDLFVTSWGPNLLYRNNGDGTFTEVSRPAGLVYTYPPGHPRWGSGATFIDYDRDGDLDLFVSNYCDFNIKRVPKPGMSRYCNWLGVPVVCGPRGLPTDRPYLYRNEGDGTFLDVSRETGIEAARNCFGLTAVAADLDGDGWQDIYAACDSTPALLFHNQGNGTFAEEGLERGVALSDDGEEQAGMGIALGDFNLDGWLDIFKTHFSEDTPALYKNTGNGDFTEGAVPAGLGVETRYTCWGTGLADLDNDGQPDIFVVTGNVFAGVEKKLPAYPYQTPRLLFRGLASGKFEQIFKEAGPGFSERRSSRGLAYGDLDNDGDLDIVIWNRNQPPSLLRNDLRGHNHWVQVLLEGVQSNRAAVGAQVTATYDHRKQVQTVLSQSSFFSANDLRLHFGLGKAKTVDLAVRWPSGEKQVFRGVSVDQLVRIREGERAPLAASAAGRELIPPAAGMPKRIHYNNPGLRVDLGVGLWAQPLPMDYDGDGDLDLVVLSGDKPASGAYLFENPGCAGKPCKMPVFRAGVRVGDYRRNTQISYVEGGFRILTPGREYASFRKHGFEAGVTLPVTTGEIHPSHGRVRANQWKYVDYDGDGDLDLAVGIGDWTEYGWDDAYNSRGEWTNGPLHGYVYLLRNQGTSESPRYAKAVRIEAGGRPVDVFGMPSPNFADFDGDGDLDLLCGEFLDGFTYFENSGSRTDPRYATGRRIPVRMDLEMITPVAVDWDHDGDPDLIVGDEDGRLAFIENTGIVSDGLPRFLPPRYFRQEASEVKFGALVTPVSFDWDGDGDEDLLCGNSAGYIGYIENLDGGDPPKWAAPVRLQAAGQTIRIQAGSNGSIQGPAEAKWGYTTLGVGDWDGDGLPDVVANSIWGKVIWYRNTGTRRKPQLDAARPVKIDWPAAPRKPAWNWWSPAPGEFVTQWRTTPFVIDWNRDGLNDLVMLDDEGYLALFERKRGGGRLLLSPGRRIFTGLGASVYDAKNKVRTKHDGPLRLNAGRAGKSGRRKFCLADWDGDGLLDLLVNSASVNFFKNAGDGRFRDMGAVRDRVLAGHTTSPTTIDWDGDGRRDLLIGAEDGYLYRVANPHW